MSDKRYSKVEEEIIQILDRMEKESPAPSRPHLRLVHARDSRPKRRISMPRPRLRTRKRPSWFWIALSMGLAVTALLVADYVPHLLVVLLAIGSIVAFFTPIFVRRESLSVEGPTGPKTWRGRDISFDPKAVDSGTERLRRWLDRRRGGRPF